MQNVPRRASRFSVFAALAAIVVSVAACSPSTSEAPLPAATPAPPPTLIALEPALGGFYFEYAVDLGAYPGGRVYVATLDGLVFLGRPDSVPDRILADLTGAVGERLDPEDGLLSISLDPEFGRNGFLYAYYVPGGSLTARLSRFEVQDDLVAPESELVMLEVEKGRTIHSGGSVLFGVDGMLYLTIGDGEDQAEPNGNAQDLTNLLGSVLRLDVRDATAEVPYRIPDDNPFVEDVFARSEIWAYGFRNPWRMAVDRLTGNLWLGDVGQDRFEEVDMVTRGQNYGWNAVEADECFPPGAACDTAATTRPVHIYDRADGCAISGGIVYRGAMSELHGRYLYGDLCSGKIWGLGTELLDNVFLAHSGRMVISFGEDEDGEAYVVAFGGPILRVAALVP